MWARFTIVENQENSKIRGAFKDLFNYFVHCAPECVHCAPDRVYCAPSMCIMPECVHCAPECVHCAPVFVHCAPECVHCGELKLAPLSRSVSTHNL